LREVDHPHGRDLQVAEPYDARKKLALQLDRPGAREVVGVTTLEIVAGWAVMTYPPDLGRSM
jgi:hypothetical protein